ncbi:MAG: hypothetical protein WC547_07745, partial [Candidatus Omnitrophota bacterium]
MNKNTILFLGLVVLCIVVVIVINIAINGPEKGTAKAIIKKTEDVITPRNIHRAQAPAPEEEQEIMPVYEATTG